MKKEWCWYLCCWREGRKGSKKVTFSFLNDGWSVKYRPQGQQGSALGNTYRRGRGLPFSLKLFVLAFLSAAIAVTLLCHLLSFLIKLDLGVRETGSHLNHSCPLSVWRTFLPCFSHWIVLHAQEVVSRLYIIISFLQMRKQPQRG